MNYELIKVCGMREPDNIRAVEALGVDWLGFIFWPRSSRYVAEKPDYLPARAKRVGVFVDATVEDVAQHVSDYRLDLVQLHGHETPEYIHQLGSAYGGSATVPRLIKALSIKERTDVAAYKAYEGLVDYFLFDTKAQLVGGNGVKFDWSVLNEYDGRTPFLLSGGIGPDDVGRLHHFHHDKCVGIDLNSRFEVAPALKDINSLKRFLYEQD